MPIDITKIENKGYIKISTIIFFVVKPSQKLGTALTYFFLKLAPFYVSAGQNTILI